MDYVWEEVKDGSEEHVGWGKIVMGSVPKRRLTAESVCV